MLSVEWKNKLRTIFCNHNKVFEKKVGLNFADIKFYNLPSTSPAYTLTLDKKIESWKDLFTEL